MQETPSYENNEEEAIARSWLTYEQEECRRVEERAEEELRRRALEDEEWRRIESLAIEDSKATHAAEVLRERRRAAEKEMMAQRIEKERKEEERAIAESLAAYWEEEQKRKVEHTIVRTQDVNRAEQWMVESYHEAHTQPKLSASPAAAEDFEVGPSSRNRIQDGRQDGRPTRSTSILFRTVSPSPSRITVPPVPAVRVREAMRILETAEEGSNEHLHGLAILDGGTQVRDAVYGLEEQDAPPAYETVIGDRVVDHMHWTTDGNEETPGAMRPLTAGIFGSRGPHVDGARERPT